MPKCHEGHRSLLAPRWHSRKPRGLVILQAVPPGVEGVSRPVLRDLDLHLIQVGRCVGVVGDERGDVLRHPAWDCQDEVMYHFRRREGVEAPVVYRRQAQAVFALPGELPVRLQLESQVGDGVGRRHRVPWVPQVGTEAQLQAQDLLCGGHGALAGVELHAHHPQVRGHCFHPLDEVLQRVGHYQQVVYVGLDEAPLGLSGRTQAVPLGPEQGRQGERVQQGAFGVALPDAAQHVDGLCQPVRGDNVQPGARVEEEQEVDGLWRHIEVT